MCRVSCLLFRKCANACALLWHSGTLWGSLSGVLSLIAACIALSAWLYIVLRHRSEKQMLTYGIVTHIKASDITTDRPEPVQPDQIRSNMHDSQDTGNIFLQEQSPLQAVTDVAREMTAWCMSRWGGPFGARAGANSMGAKLGVWNDRFDNVQCAVMLLAFYKLNAVIVLKHQKSRIGSDDPGTLTLMAIWFVHCACCSHCAIL